MDNLHVPYKNINNELRVNFETIERWAASLQSAGQVLAMATSDDSTSTTSTSYSEYSTELRASFSAPTSGCVGVRVTAPVNCQTAGEYMEWQLWDVNAGAQVGQIARPVGGTASGLAATQIWKVTGLAPAKSYTLTLRYRSYLGNAVQMRGDYGGAHMEVFILPPEAT